MARTISLPYATNFTTDDLNDIRWTDCAATVTHSSSGGYAGTGASKHTPPTSACTSENGGMSSIGNFEGFSTARLNVRFLIKFGSSYVTNKQGAVNKFIDVHDGSGTRYGILGLHKEESTMSPAVCPYTSSWYVFRSPGTADEDHYFANASLSWTDAILGGAWYCLEYEINTTAGTTTMWWTKADGTQTSVTSPMDETGNMTTVYIGGYHNGYGTEDTNNYLLIDNLVISNTYIGPPAGFLTGDLGKTFGKVSADLKNVNGKSIGSINKFLGVEY